MELKFLLNIVNSTFPIETAMSGDRIGLQVQTESNLVNGLLITLEVTEEVIQECIQQKINTILTFHPLIYAKLATISLSERVGKLCSLLIKNSINLLSIHTTFDAYIYGTSRILAEKLDLKPIGFLVPNQNIANSGMGIIAEPKINLTAIELIKKVNEVCASPIRYSFNENWFAPTTTKTFNKIAIVGGSGTSFISDVLVNNCDAFITADATYHQFHSHKDKLLLIDVGHYEMEQFVPAGIARALESFFNENNLRYETSKVLTNPIRYYPNDANYTNNQINILNK